MLTPDQLRNLHRAAVWPEVLSLDPEVPLFQSSSTMGRMAQALITVTMLEIVLVSQCVTCLTKTEDGTQYAVDMAPSDTVIENDLDQALYAALVAMGVVKENQ